MKTEWVLHYTIRDEPAIWPYIKWYGFWKSKKFILEEMTREAGLKHRDVIKVIKLDKLR